MTTTEPAVGQWVRLLAAATSRDPARLARAAAEALQASLDVPVTVAIRAEDGSWTQGGAASTNPDELTRRAGDDAPTTVDDPARVGLAGTDPVRLLRIRGQAAARGAVAVPARRAAPGAQGATPLDTAPMADVAAILAAGLNWREERAELTMAVERLEHAQSLAHMGSYDWDITTDTNRWSDELYRIYGAEPQSFNATYERFLAYIHPDDREKIQEVHKHAYATGEPYETIERIVRDDGQVRVLSTTGHVIQDVDGTPLRMAGVCADITDMWEQQQQAEEARLRRHDDELRRRQALELNDNVLQGLTSVLFALEEQDVALAREAADGTLAAARTMVDKLMDGIGTGTASLLRDEAAGRVIGSAGPRAPTAATTNTATTDADTATVLVVDDSDDLRLLLFLALERAGDLAVVAEATNGREAIELARTHRPDVVLLDLAMPVMDGIEALPLIREALPDATIVALSGFPQHRMRDAALTAGADAYVEKGLATHRLVQHIRELRDNVAV